MDDSVILRVRQRSSHLLKLIEICAGDSEFVTTESSEIFQPVSRKLRGPLFIRKVFTETWRWPRVNNSSILQPRTIFLRTVRQVSQ